MKTLLGLALLMIVVSGCSSSQGDAEMFAVSEEDNNQMAENNQGAEFGQQQGLLNNEEGDV